MGHKKVAATWSTTKKGPEPSSINMEVDVHAIIWLETKTKGLEPNNINDVNVASWSTTKTKGLKPSSINCNLINNKNRRLETLQHQLLFH